MSNETRRERFKRLAKQRGDRVLRDLHLLGNLSNRGNYEYNEEEIRKLFRVLEEELKRNKLRFQTSKRREIDI